jgi:soluble lytic murein transglycosylase-like protein
MSAWSTLLILVIVRAAPGFARADVYSFTDANGAPHFSNVPADSRYQLLIATPTDAGAGAPKEKSIDWLARSAQYDGVISGAAKAATIQAALVRAIIVVESGFNPRAVSKKGAIGLMQLLPATAKRYGARPIISRCDSLPASARTYGSMPQVSSRSRSAV